MNFIYFNNENSQNQTFFQINQNVFNFLFFDMNEKFFVNTNFLEFEI